ncbi:hypothetical protein DL98DRAFT_622567 [Cadophora sp. DSE1049]|nr:hypothetical protein DL98DRAFT_622567 [Cadophora sp. DSE1049]
MSEETETSIELQTPTELSDPPSTHTYSSPSILTTASSLAPEEPPLTKEEIDTKPWKYIGYRGYVDFIASENDFYIMRRFAALNTRAALALQDEVVVLEERLERLDRRHCRRVPENDHNGSFREDREERRELLGKIVDALTKYNAFMLQQSELKKFPQAARQDLQSVRNWHFNHGGKDLENGEVDLTCCAISPEEQEYLDRPQDLFSVVPREKAPLRRLLDRSRKFRIASFWRSNEAPSLPIYDQDVITYTSDKRIDRFVAVLIVWIGTVMLLVPMWILQALDKSNHKLGVITAFVVVFLGLVSYATVAKPFETLAATAAYSAVLMVFLQLGSPGAGGTT